jgi:RHS repeat-associated protein
MGSLRSAVTPAGQVDFKLDALGRRVARSKNGSLERQWAYGAGPNPVVELDANNKITRRFVYTDDRNVPDFMATVGSDGSKVLYRLLTDQLGSVRLVVNASTGEVAQEMDYDAFGNVLKDTNPQFQPFGFAGGIYDPDTHLVRFGARDYDAEFGRWTSKDPILFAGRQTNIYVYVNNDPVNRWDPSGLGYTDLNITGSILPGLGITFGLFVTDKGPCGRREFHPYFGGGLVSPGAAFTISRGTGSPSPKLLSWQVALSAIASPLTGGAVAWGSDFPSSGTRTSFVEGGPTFGAPAGVGASLTGYYTW